MNFLKPILLAVFGYLNMIYNFDQAQLAGLIILLNHKGEGNMMKRYSGRFIARLVAVSLIFTQAATPVYASGLSAEDETVLEAVSSEDTVSAEPVETLSTDEEITADEVLLEDEPAEDLIGLEPETEYLTDESENVSLASCDETEDEAEEDIERDGDTVDSGTEAGTSISWSLDDKGTLTLSGTGSTRDYNKTGTPSISDRPWNSYKTTVKKLIVREGITRIGDRAFQSFSGIEIVRLHSSLESIGDYAFQQCGKLTSVVAYPGIELEKDAFDQTPVKKDAENDIAAIENEKYKACNFYKNLCKVSLTGNYRDDVIAIAKSQIGYHEGNSADDFGGGNTSGDGDYTEYGRYLGSSGNAWCSEFASWCVRMAGVPVSLLANSRGANANNFTSGSTAQYHTWSDTIWGGGDYTPGKGDIILWVLKSGVTVTPSTDLSHTTIIDTYEEDGDDIIFHVVHGNSNGQVGTKDYTVKKSNGIQSESQYVGYFVAPDYENTSITKQTVTFDGNGGNVDPTSKQAAKDGLYGPLPIPAWDGHDFLGWYDGSKRINMYSPCTLTSDRTLKALWNVAPPVEYLRKDAKEESIDLYDNTMPVKEMGTGVHGQLFTYDVGDDTYTALYIWADQAGGVIESNDRIRGDSLYGNTAKSKITDIIFDDSISKVNSGYFFDNMQKVSYIRLSENLTEIAGGCFADNKSLPEITIPKSLESTGENIFGGCEALKKVTFENGISKIPDLICKVGGGEDAGYIETVIIPPSVKEIGESAFNNQERLTTVIFSEPEKTTLARIGVEAFYGTNLSGITLPKFGGKWDTGIQGMPLQKPEIGALAFGGIKNPAFEDLIIPAGVTRLYQINNGGNYFKRIYLPDTFVNEGLYYAFTEVDAFLPTLEHIYFAGSKAHFLKAFHPNVKPTGKWFDEKMVYDHGAPTQVSAITASENIIVKYLDEISEGETEKLYLTVSPTDYIETEFRSESTDKSVAEATVGTEADGRLLLTLTYHEKTGETNVTVAGGLAATNIRVIIKEKDPAEEPCIRLISGTGSDYGDKIAVESETPGAQIFYVLDKKTDSTNLNSTNIKWNETEGRYKSASPDTIREYTGKAIVIGEDTDDDHYRIHAVAVKKGLKFSDVLNEGLAKPDRLEYKWGDIIKEDRIMPVEDIPAGVWAPENQLESDELIYTGKGVTIPGLRVYFKNRLLKLKTDYTLKYSDNVNASSGAKIRVTLKGNYSGTKDLTFRIKKRVVSENDIDLGNVTCNVLNVNARKDKSGSYVSQKPDPKVVVFGRTLKPGVDYTISYNRQGSGIYYVDDISDPGIYNINLGTSSLPRENYTFTNVKLMGRIHCIGAENVPAGKITVSKIADQNIADWSAKGYEVKPLFTVTYGGRELTAGEDGNYTYEYKNNDRAGKASLIISGTGKTVSGDKVAILGSKTVTFNIKGIPFNSSTVKAAGLKTALPYTGSVIDPTEDPAFSLSCNNTGLVKGDDYSVSFKKAPLNAGKYKMTLSGKGIYQGSVVYNITVNKVPLTDPEIEVTDTENLVWNEDFKKVCYTGKGVKPAFKVQYKVNGVWKVLTSKDYKVKYINNKGVAEYDKTGKGGKNAGPAIVITGKGNFTGSLTKRFTIIKSNVHDLTLTVPDMVKVNKANKFARKFTLTDTNGAKLKAGRDYVKTPEYSYAEDVRVRVVTGKGKKAKTTEVLRIKDTPVSKSDIIPAGAVIKVTVTGKGNYEGTVSRNFTVADRSVKNLKFEVAGGPYTYTGRAVTPDKADIKVYEKVNRKWVEVDPSTASRYFDITGYSNNVKKGKKAKVMIRAKGGYAGTTSIKFSIIAAR